MERTLLLKKIYKAKLVKNFIFFTKNIIFSLLPFKALFILTLLFRRLTKRHGLDAHFSFFCGSKVNIYQQWIFKGFLSKYYFNDIIHLIDETCHSMAWITQLHSIDWPNCKDPMREKIAQLIISVLEHRVYEYEERRFQSKKILGDAPETITIEKYCPHFFLEKQVVSSLIADLKLEGAIDIFTAMEANGEYIDNGNDYISDRKLFSNIKLFYAYRHLALRTYHHGEGHLIPMIAEKILNVQHCLRQFLPTPSKELSTLLERLGINLSDLRLLSPDWSALIGHNGHLNVHLMMHKMGWWHGSPVLLAYKARIANQPFLSLFSELCPTLTLNENTCSDIWLELAGLTPFLGISHQLFTFEDGRSMYWNDAGSMALQEWESQNRGFPLREIYDCKPFYDEAEMTFSQLRKKWGMRDNDWHVCLHMRDAETRGDKEGAGESIRNTSFENYIEAINYITNLGGWVIRMGGNKAPKLSEMLRVIDYARSGDTSPLMDIHLVRKARLFIGTTSGFAYVASSFGIPTAMVNAISSVGLLWSKDTRFALKPIRTKEGRLLSQQEVVSEQWRWAFPTHESLHRAGLIVSENTADEILETVREVFELTTQHSSPPMSSLIETWRASLRLPGFYGSSIPSKYFLEKYADSFLLNNASESSFISTHSRMSN